MTEVERTLLIEIAAAVAALVHGNEFGRSYYPAGTSTMSGRDLARKLTDAASEVIIEAKRPSRP